MKTCKGFIAAMFVAVVVSASAFDADTMAFYTLDDGVANDSAIGGVVENKVDSSKYNGTITAMKGSTSSDGTAHWLSDAPGKYVFARGGYKPDCIYTNPACLQVEQFKNGRGIKCAFDSLASDIGNLSEWTVEWFYKLPSGYSSYDASNGSWWQLPLWTTYSTYAPAWMKLGESPASDTKMVDFRVFTSQLGKGINLNMHVASIADDQWHHIAIRYKSGKVCLVADYGAQKSSEVAMSIAPTNEPIAMLLPANGHFHGRISCIRVSKKCLSEDRFMIASNNPDCYPRTAFHFDLDGEAGADSPSSISNRAYAASLAIVNSEQVGMKKYTGFGTYGVDTNGNHSVFCAELPKGPSKRCITEGRLGDVLGKNISSLRMPTLPLSVSAPTDEAIWTTGTKLKIGASSLPPVDSSFTMELFAKVDYDSWNENTQYTSGERRRTTIMGVDTDDSGYHNWVLSVIPAASGGKFTLGAYNSTNKAFSVETSYSIPFSNGEWHHIAVTYDQRTYKLSFYFDYSLKKTIQLDVPLRTGNLSTQTYYVGGALNNHSFDGWMDEVRLVRECLSPDKFIQFSSGLGMHLKVK